MKQFSFAFANVQNNDPRPPRGTSFDTAFGLLRTGFDTAFGLLRTGFDTAFGLLRANGGGRRLKTYCSRSRSRNHNRNRNRNHKHNHKHNHNRNHNRNRRYAAPRPLREPASVTDRRSPQ